VTAAKFGIVGGGFRSEVFKKLGGVLREQLELAGVAVRRAERAGQLRASWGAPTFSSPRGRRGTAATAALENLLSGTGDITII
jgi:hypothetical protein